MKGYLSGGHVSLDASKAGRLLEKGFGSVHSGRLWLSLSEACYLLERGSIKVLEGGRELSAGELMTRLRLPEYLVYRDLRERGYVVRSGFKYGADFRVYERGAYRREHSKYLVKAVDEGFKVSVTELAGAVRLAHGVRKKLLLGVCDHDGSVNYYLVERLTL